MAAITSGKRKEIAMQRAEGLTDIWDVFKAWMGRAAEIVLTICMFAQLVGMLPGVSYPGWASNAILGVQIIMLDFGAFALAPLAEQARNMGQDDAAKQAEDMAKFLIRLVIFTIVLITIGQFSAIAGKVVGPVIKTVVGYAEPILILVRVGFVVKYIHVIHSLRGSTTLAIQPTPVQQTLNYQELAQAIIPHLPAANDQGQNIDYQQVAKAIAPMLEATFRATIVKEIKATVAPVSGPLLEARATSRNVAGPVIEATLEGQKATRARTTKRSTGPLTEATQDDTRASDEKLEAAYQQLLAEGGRISGRSLAPLAHVNKNRAAQWLRATHPEASGQGQDDEPGPLNEATLEGHFIEATDNTFGATPEGHYIEATYTVGPEMSEATGPVEIQ